MPSFRIRRRWLGLTVLLCPLVLIIVVSCSRKGARDGAVANAKMGMAVSAPVAEQDFAGRGAVAGAAPPALQQVVATSANFASNQSKPSSPASPASPSMIIRNGTVVIEVDSVQRSIDAVRKVAASVGGYIGNVEMSTGENQVHSATLEMKVPAPRFDDALAGVRPIGKVESSSASAEDVGEEFVDVSARIANGKRLEERLVRLLETRTGKLTDVLQIERELARVREEIERQEGRIRYLSAHIATSTISVTVHEKPPLVATTPGTNPMTEAVKAMWRNMVGMVAFGIQMLGVVIPPAILAALAWLVVRRLRRRGTLNPQPSV